MPAHEITRAMMQQAAFLNRENSFFHNAYDKESEPFHYMVNGEKEKMLEAMDRNWLPSGTGTLSKDPLQNAKYLFVASITMAARYCVEWGMDVSEAYDASDLYIRRMDVCRDRESIAHLRRDMMCFYCDAMADRKKQADLSLPVVRTMNYIEGHLHDRITLELLAENAGVSRSYLSALFHRETGVRLSSYITGRRIEAAKNMLLYTVSTAAEISEYLGFSNPSHFQRAFRQATGMTPNAYRRSMENYSLHAKADADPHHIASSQTISPVQFATQR